MESRIPSNFAVAILNNIHDCDTDNMSFEIFLEICPPFSLLSCVDVSTIFYSAAGAKKVVLY